MASFVQLTSTENPTGNGLVYGAVSGTSLFVGPGATVFAGGSRAVGVYMRGEFATVTLAGQAVGDNGVFFTQNSARLQVQDGGGVSGAYIGVRFGGSGVLVNRGDISCVGQDAGGGAGGGNSFFGGFGHAVSAAGPLRAVNYGLISATDWGVLAEAGGTLVNHGQIEGYNGVALLGRASSLTNLGAITAEGAAVRLSTLDDVVINRGAIVSSGYGLEANAGDDLVDTAGGRIEGLVDLGAGDDDYFGGAFTDRVNGGAGADTIRTGGGRDILVARLRDGEDDYDGGADVDLYDARTITLAMAVNLTSGVVSAGDEIDRLIGVENVYGGVAGDRLVGEGSANLLMGFAGADRLYGLSGDDRLHGGAGADRLDGGAGADRLLGDAGNDSLIGGTGDDALYGGLDADRLDGGDGADRLFGDAGNDVLSGGAGADRLNGGIDADSLAGGDGDDNLNGAEGRDTLAGGAGADVITGSYDIDLMSGGLGADRFDFNDIDEFFPVSGGGLDRITDFVRGVDKIDLSTIDAISVSDLSNEAFVFIGAAQIAALGRVSYDIIGGATFISISVNAPSELQVLRLDGVHALTAADFLL